TNNVHYATPEERILHDVLTCLKEGVTLDDAGRHLRPNAEWHLRPAAELHARWRHAPEGLRTSVALAERCTFRFAELTPKLPSIPQPDSFADPDDYLAHLTWEGARTRWGRGITPMHRAQLEKELALIRRRGLSGYFLIMWEIVEFARSVDILTQGRGSAANSAVCYCLGITAVDPIRFDLLFERFLSDARDGYPDIDLDIEHTRREEVIQWVYHRYGRTHAAMVCAHICFRGKSAVRDTARVLGFGFDEGGRLAEQVGRHDLLDEDAVRAAGFDPTQPRVQALLRVVLGLWGVPRHRSIHVGGFVLSTQPIGEIVPVEPAAMEARTIIQWDKDDLEHAKLPKFDLLGLGMLSALAEGLRLVRSRFGIPATLYGLPDRQEVYDMIARADTVGVFQIESRAQMNTLPRTRPQTLYELAIQVALIRPGPLQGDMVHPYIRRKRGEEPVDLIHPALAPILRRTLGVPLFQEQGMRLAVEAGGFTPDEAEMLRKAVGSERHRHRLAALLDQLRAGMRARGIDGDAADRIVSQIEAFSTYGFPESHSTSFALLVYASCWLKCFYPAEFVCALLNAQPMGFYAPSTLIKDAQRRGVEVRPPCLRRSGWRSTMEGHAVRLGLRLVVGLANGAMRRLEAARAEGPFASAEDVVRRAGLTGRALATLAEAGAFDAFFEGQGRRDAVWRVLHLGRTLVGTLPLGPPPDPVVELPAQSPREVTISDLRTKALTTGPHLVAHARPLLARRGVVPAAQLPRTPRNHWVRVAGVVNCRQRPPTAKGFFFLTLEDETGFVNVIVPPDLFERHRTVLSQAGFLQVEGPVATEQGVWNVKGRRFEALTVEGTEHLPRGVRFR
ncbi:MAG: error-prone DNA polymerase, partial [Myxococcales bacterium]|nr:error-prone DNA polymerase [Myxococcales bacterium]